MISVSSRRAASPRTARPHSVSIFGLVSALAAALGMSACSEGPGRTAWTATVDTLAGGTVHVVNRPPEDGISPTWVIEPEVTIGTAGEAGPASFGQVKGVAPLPDGRIVVLDAQAQQLRVFGPDGEHLRTLGGEGAGPGELRDANGLVVGPDGLIRVNDPRNARLSLFHPDSGFIGSERLEVMMWGFLWDAAVDSAGRLYEVNMVGGDEGRSRAIKVYDPRGRWTDTIRLAPAASPGDDPPGVYRYERGLSTVPFWPRAVRALDPRGSFWGTAADVNDYRIVRTSFGGDTLLVFESRREPLPVTTAERDAAIATIRERAGGRELDWSKIPTEKPIVENVFLDDAGRVWVRVNASDTLVTFDVFSRDGRYRGTAVTPLAIPSYWKPAVRGEAVYTLVTDELDVPYAVRGRIREVREER